MSFASGAMWDGMKRADRGILRDLIKHYGSSEAADEAIREAMKDSRAIEEWATVVQNEKYRKDRRQAEIEGRGFYFVSGVDLGVGESWTFEHLPPSLRSWALESMAAAMLAWTVEQERGAA